jgi:hypothetical protein
VFRKIVLAALAVLAVLLVIGAMASTTSHDKVQGVVQTLIVNDTSVTVGLGLCHDLSCSETDSVQSLKPGDTYNQALGPNETQLYAVVVDPEKAIRSAAVPGKSYRCTQLVSGARVAARYSISSFVPCGATDLHS